MNFNLKYTDPDFVFAISKEDSNTGEPLRLTEAQLDVYEQEHGPVRYSEQRGFLATVSHIDSFTTEQEGGSLVRKGYIRDEESGVKLDFKMWETNFQKIMSKVQGDVAKAREWIYDNELRGEVQLWVGSNGDTVATVLVSANIAGSETAAKLGITRKARVSTAVKQDSLAGQGGN